MAGTPLLRINGLDTVWINAAIPEVQVGRVAASAPVEVRLPAFPGERFAGRIESLLPDIDTATRTQLARIVLENPGHRLAPGMFAQVDIAASTQGAAAVLVPADAVIATGLRHVVIVDSGQGSSRTGSPRWRRSKRQDADSRWHRRWRNSRAVGQFRSIRRRA
jgi:Cu(I)/Ag(I) efflux system membrane fusion protein